MNKLKIKGFTLVELIIVITILVILATMSFVSFQNYTKYSRDANRLSTIKNISKGIETYLIKTGNVPNVDNQFSTGSIGVDTLSYVGNIGENVSRVISMSEVPKDPLTGNDYIYGIDANKTKYQIGGVKEEGLVSKVEGNYNGLLKNNSKIYNIPSLIFTGSGNLISDETYYIIDGGKNIAYSLDNKELTNSEVGIDTLKILTNNPNVTSITGITIPSFTGYTLSGAEYSTLLGYNLDTLGINLFSKDYTISKQNISNNLTGISGPTNTGVYSNMPINTILSTTLSKGTLSNGNLTSSPGSWNSNYGIGGIADIAMTTGKRYWEITCMNNSQNAFAIGISNTTNTDINLFYTSDKTSFYYGYDGNIYKSGLDTVYGNTFTDGDIIGVLFDADLKTIEFFKNGSSQGVQSIGITGSSFYPININGSSGHGNYVTYNFGASNFTYPNNAD